MSLTDQQQEALSLELALYPHEKSLAQIARDVGVAERTLRRWRATDEWAEARRKQDDADMQGIFRQSVLANPDNSSMWRVWWDRFGSEDSEMTEHVLKMTDAEAVAIAQEASEWLEGEREAKVIAALRE